VSDLSHVCMELDLDLETCRVTSRLQNFDFDFNLTGTLAVLYLIDLSRTHFAPLCNLGKCSSNMSVSDRFNMFYFSHS